ncbi:hypothetical protein [Candidatus Spongiihabitans sp.]|uniref:hypothetical protein n=1 Tax=Candidatus Spongiihabitans sp. TaxID=3101308 RepID=UPI003C70029F
MTNSGKFSNSQISKLTAEGFLRALSTEQVNEILKSRSEFSDDKNWKPYGGAEKNWDRVGVQTSEPVGALAELIINSIDAILMRKAKEKRLDLESEAVPQSMSEAVKLFFPEVQEGKLTLLSQGQRTKLAEKSVLIGIQRKAKRDTCPNYTIVDFGEGQNHGDFEKTFLSLGEKNKDGIPFVQGRFNMGSTGSITFCTRAEIRSGMYKLILSKRNLDDSDGLWGWTLIRVRSPHKGEDLPVVEYFCPNGEIACFEADEIRAFNDRADIGVVKDGGSVVKLYEYDIGPGSRNVDLGLYDALTTSLIDCALPLRFYDFDAKPTKVGLRAEGIAPRTFSGMKTVLKSDDEEGETSRVDFEGVTENSENSSLGTIRISYFVLDKMKEYLRNYSYRMFYTINGQSQAKERASLLRKAQLDDLRNHLLVQIDCNAMDNTARSAVFKPDRERMAQIELTRELKEIVIDSLREDRELRKYAREIKKRRQSEQIEKESSKEFLSDLVKNNLDLQELFDAGDIVVEPVQTSGGEDKYEGKMFPTYLKPTNLEEGDVKSIPINSYRWIVCKTDAQNDYLIREADQGKFLHPMPDVLPNSGSLRNGKFRIKVSPPENAKVKDEISVQFGFNDSNPERTTPLLFDVTIKISNEEKTTTNSGGDKTNTRKKKERSLNFPDIVWVKMEDWDNYNYTEESGGHVSVGEELTVYVNQGNKYLLYLVLRERDEDKREIIRHRFRFGVGILTLAMYKKLIHDAEKENSGRQEDYDEDKVLRLASSAIAAHVVTLIERLGGDK